MTSWNCSTLPRSHSMMVRTSSGHTVDLTRLLTMFCISDAGHMIVELLDYRPLKAKDPILDAPEKTRVVLSPTAETLWTNLCLLSQKAGNVWTDEDVLEVEAKILVRVLIS